MKPVITDNSLCVYALKDNVSAELVYEYIEALRDVGVRYVELDFRAVMKLNLRLPEGVGYIFRLMDPMFASLAEAVHFDYILITASDLNKGIKIDVPIMLECQTADSVTAARISRAASQMVNGDITAVRFRESFPILGIKDSENWRIMARKFLMLPIDICPMNEHKTALDTAMKFTRECVDSITLTMGNPERYCSLEDYLFTLMTVFEALPRVYSLNALCRASVYQNALFRNGNGDRVSRILDILDRDMQFMVNVDTGKKVNPKAIVRNSRNVKHEYITALESLAKREKWSPEDYEMIMEELKRFGDSFYNPGLLDRGGNTRFRN